MLKLELLDWMANRSKLSEKREMVSIESILVGKILW